MAPIPDSAYFPSLDKFFEGNQLLISWKSACYVLLRHLEFAIAKPSTLDGFFSDPTVLELLAHPYKLFPAPSQETKSAFETKTSAINVTPSSITRYDIKEVKEDALWLSKEAKIDEVSALRVVIVECQDRPSAQLLQRLSREESESIQETAGALKAPSSLILREAAADAEQDDFDSLAGRRVRILRTYLSERRNALQCLNITLQASLYPPKDASIIGKEKGAADTISWVRALGGKVRPTDVDVDKFVVEALAAIRSNVENVENGSRWFEADGGREDVETDWIRNQIIEMSHILEIIYQVLDTHPSLSSSTVVIAWLEAMENSAFFDEFPTEDPIAEALFLPLKTTATLISLSILCPSVCIDFLTNADVDPRISPEAPLDLPYILNLRTITQIHATVIRVSDEMPSSAAPMVLAWADILQAMSNRVAIRGQVSDEEAYRQGSTGDAFEATVSKMLENIADETVDVIQYLASSAVDRGGVFQILTHLGLRLGGTSISYFSAKVGARMRITILDLMSSSVAVGYIPELVEATLSALTGGQTYWDFSAAENLCQACNVPAYFLNQVILVQLVLSSAKNRFPFESALLKMTRPLSTCYDMDGASFDPLILHEIGTMETFTCRVPDGFNGYTTTQEEENTNSIRLTTTLHLFEDGVRMRGMQRTLLALWRVDPDFVIPSNTLGRMILDSPKVAYLSHNYSGLKYFGKLLETFLAAGDVTDTVNDGAADRDSVADIIGTFAGLLRGNSKAAETYPDSIESLRSEARGYIDIAGSGLSQNRDIVGVIFDIFQEELQRHSTNFASDVSLDVLISCVEFIHAVLPFYPGRVWPLMSRSGILELGRSGGRLATIVGSIEMVACRFDLLLACTSLFEALVEDAVSNVVYRANLENSGARFEKEDLLEMGTGVFGQTLSKILLSFTRYFVDILENSCTWKFVVQDERRRLRKNITNTFDRILRYAYGIDSQSKSGDDADSKSKDRVLFKMIMRTQAKQVDKKPELMIMESVLPAASHLAETFLSTSSGALRFRPLLEVLHDGFNSTTSTTFINGMILRVGQVNAILSLAATLLRVGVLLRKSHSQLEQQLFKASPLIARLYAVDEACRQPVVSLFEALLISASIECAEPPSLLGFLGTQTSKNFLRILSDLDKPLRRYSCTTAIWQFLGVVVSNRQQWFANYILTGQGSKNPSKSKEGGKSSAMLDRPLLDTALDALSRISTLYKPDALAMLDFVALAQNFWPWATYTAAKHAAFIDAISEYMGTLKPVQPSPRFSDAMDACYQTRIAAYVAEILAMHVFHSRQMGNKISTKDMIPNLSYYTRFAAALPSYNSSLHGSLKRNFELRYPSCSILDFERTALEKRPLGREYFYNYPLMNRIFSHDRSWRRPDGLGAEVLTANVNLSLVDAQIALLHGWSFLAIELSNDLSDQPELQKLFAKLSSDCLVSNKRSQGLEEIFQRLNQRRAELALILIQRLMETRTDKKELDGLLATIWDTIQHSETSFERAFLAGNVDYYRTLLKLLFLGLRVHADTGPKAAFHRRSVAGMPRDPTTAPDSKSPNRLREPSSIIPTALTILESVVAIGLGQLATFIHDKPADSHPEDVALLTGILQACLRIPGVEFCYPQIVSMFTMNDTARVAVSLFSWSDSLAIEGDPVYGELSMLFLLELSTIPPMAEQLAIEGVLGQISGTNITTFLRRTMINPSTDSAGIQRCYNIWVRGILPLLLNILVAVGDAIGTEIALFVNQFPNLLKQSSEAFDTPETSRIVARGTLKNITLSMCSEIHSLSLILYILHGFRQSDGGTVIPDVKWDIGNVLEGVEYWLGSRVLLRERIFPMGEQVGWTKKVNGISKLEDKVVEELCGIRDVLTELSGGT